MHPAEYSALRSSFTVKCVSSEHLLAYVLGIGSFQDSIPVMFSSRYAHLCVAPSQSVSGLVWEYGKSDDRYMTYKAQS